jgi:peroxiredoxin
VYPYFLFTAFLQAPSLPPRVPLLEDCSEGSRVIAMLAPADKVQVHFSMDGGTQTCYAVSASIGTQAVSGHVLGTALATVQEFERQRTQPPLSAQERAVTPVPGVKQAPPRLPMFADFSGVDVKDRRLNFGSMSGKVILVCFWSPRNQASERELIAVTALYSRFHRQGLEAVGISLDRQRAEIIDSLEDFGTTFPNMADASGVGQRQGVSAESVPYTFILNQQHEIVASGLHDRQLETTVQKLMAER